jgi:hypothetical protein
MLEYCNKIERMENVTTIEPLRFKIKSNIVRVCGHQKVEDVYAYCPQKRVSSTFLHITLTYIPE